LPGAGGMSTNAKSGKVKLVIGLFFTKNRITSKHCKNDNKEQKI